MYTFICKFTKYSSIHFWIVNPIETNYTFMIENPNPITNRSTTCRKTYLKKLLCLYKNDVSSTHNIIIKQWS